MSKTFLALVTAMLFAGAASATSPAFAQSPDNSDDGTGDDGILLSQQGDDDPSDHDSLDDDSRDGHDSDDDGVDHDSHDDDHDSDDHDGNDHDGGDHDD